jgi:rSAM/selenodomain-associated transferase 2
MSHQFSFIIPVYRESNIINAAIENLLSLYKEAAAEIIVVDGEGQKNTIDGINVPGVKKIITAKGRANQLNCGAREATGDVLVFLHADTRLPEDAVSLIEKLLDDETYAGGAFDLGIDSPRFAFRIIEKMASARSRLTRIPYGDQAIFIRSRHFRALGGFLDIPIMEDVDLMRRLKRNKRKIHILKEKVMTSPRRWEKEGIFYCTLRNWLLVTLYLLGVKPEKLVQFYRD